MWGFVAVTKKTMAAVGRLKRICKHAFCVAGAVQETSPSDILRGQGTDFLRRVAFWSMRSSGLLRWFCDLSIYSSICLSIWKVAIMRDFLQKRKLTCPKPSNSTSHPQKIEVLSSKMMIFCETSPKIWRWQREKQTNSARQPFKYGKLCAELTASCQYVCDFSSPFV